MAAEMSRLITPISLVDAYIKSNLEKTDPVQDYDVYIVWFCYILGGWKALLSTTLRDGMYYEVTHSAVKKETYIDVYKKFHNIKLVNQS